MVWGSGGWGGSGRRGGGRKVQSYGEAEESGDEEELDLGGCVPVEMAAGGTGMLARSVKADRGSSGGSGRGTSWGGEMDGGAGKMAGSGGGKRVECEEEGAGEEWFRRGRGGQGGREGREGARSTEGNEGEGWEEREHAAGGDAREGERAWGGAGGTGGGGRELSRGRRWWGQRTAGSGRERGAGSAEEVGGGSRCESEGENATRQLALYYDRFPAVLEGYLDASWITGSSDSKSTTGWIFTLGGEAVCWGSKKQTCITHSTMEAEFLALAAVGKEAEWLRNMLLDIELWP
ncbi:hypothetical protein Tco_1540954 [Tanacetum coccineum]